MNCQQLNDIEGLQFVPVSALKQPTVKDWPTSTVKHDLSNVVAVGLVCGAPSGNVECLDIDLKYSLDSKLFEKYKRLVQSANETLLNKLVVQKTRSGGYHLIYRCSEIAGNLKLAKRYTIADEKADTYKKTYDAEILKGVDDNKAKLIAEKAAANDKTRVLFETRGIGGQFVCHPTDGYDFVFGDVQSISEISPEEREILHSVARQFHEVVEEYTAPKYENTHKKTKGVSSFQDYNERGDIVGLLENNGWKVVGNKGGKTIFLRPGQTTSQTSGNYDHDKKWFSVFSTSTEFEPERAYLPYAVFAVLECNKDFSAASKKLYELGFGDRYEDAKEKAPSTRAIPSRVNIDDEDYSFLATGQDYDNYLHQVKTGTLQMGLSTHCPLLDEYFVFKEGNMVSINGIDNTGKTDFVWWLQMIAAMYYGWQGLIYASENTLGGCMRRMIQYYWGKPLNGQYAMTEAQYKIAKDFVEKHFFLLKAQEELYNYKDIINFVRKARKKIPNLKYCMIDPYNSLKVDLTGFSKLSTHDYHYEALSEIKAYGQQTKFGWFINHHAYTGAARQKDGDKKYPVAPRKEDTEHGVKVANKTDDFLTVHRLTQHPTEWMITELHVRKIKDTDTGGRPTPQDSPIRFEMYKNKCAFIEKIDGIGLGVDPIAKWHRANNTQQPEIFSGPKQLAVNMWTPYKPDNDEEITF